MAGDLYSTAQWRRLRVAILDRDDHVCQIQGPGCRGKATVVDHIIPWRNGGAKLDPANLRAACITCNSAAANKGRAVGWLTARTRIHLVIGPPGAGKTTWVREHANPDDLIVDWDALAEATRPGTPRTATPEQSPTSAQTGRGEATRRARNAILTALRRGEIDVADAWIISTNPEAETIFPHHDIVRIDPGRDQALARRPQLADVIHAWYDRGPLLLEQASRNW